MNSTRNDYFIQTGYSVFGPILLGYINWIIKQYKNRNIDIILCPSRDGFIIDKVMSELYPNIKTSYFYISRLASVIPLLSSKKNLYSMLDLYKSWPYTFTVDVLLKRLGINCSTSQLIGLGISANTTFRKNDIYKDKRILELFNRFKTDIYENSDSQKKLLLMYLNPYQGKKVGFIDLGSETVLSALILFCKENNINIKFESLNFQGSNDSNFCNKNNAKIKTLFRFSYILLELFFSAPHPSIIKYRSEDNKTIEPIFSENQIYSEIIELLQSGAITYVKEFSDSDTDIFLPFSGLYQLGMYPDKNDIHYWGDIKIDANSTNQSLLFCLGLKYLKLNEVSLYLKSALWLSGQLRFFGVPLWILRLIYATYFIKYKLTK